MWKWLLSMIRCCDRLKRRGRVLTAATIMMLIFTPELRAQRWSAHEALRIGGDTDPAGTLFGHISMAIADSSGRIYVGDADSYGVRVFSAAGRLERTVGRRGRGPGEFESLYAMGFLRGGLWVSDDVLNRVVFFDMHGRPDSSMLVTYRPPSGLGSSVPIALLADGSTIIKPVVPGDRAVGDGQVPLPIVRVHPSGRVDTLHVLQIGGVGVRIDLGGAQALVRHPLPTTPKNDVAFDGGILAIAEPAGGAGRGRLSSFRLLVKDSQGRLLGERLVPYTRLRVPIAWRDSVLGSYTQARTGGSPAAQQLARRIADALEFPEYFPPVEQILIGGDRTVWVRLYGTDSLAQWLVFDQRATPIGRVQIPATTRVTHATSRVVIGTSTTADDEPIVVRYDVSISAGAREH